MFNFFEQVCRNIVTTCARFGPEITNIFFDVIRICVIEIEWDTEAVRLELKGFLFAVSVDLASFSKILVEFVSNSFGTCYLNTIMNETWRKYDLKVVLFMISFNVSNVFRTSLLYLLNSLW